MITLRRRRRARPGVEARGGIPAALWPGLLAECGGDELLAELTWALTRPVDEQDDARAEALGGLVRTPIRAARDDETTTGVA